MTGERSKQEIQLVYNAEVITGRYNNIKIRGLSLVGEITVFFLFLYESIYI